MATNKDKLIASAQKLVEKGQFEKAIKEYLKVVQTDDKDVRIWLKIGDLYAKLGKRAEATETYQKVAEFYSDQGFYLKSVAVYKQILKIDPRLVDVNQRLAELYKQLGLLSDAMQQYETVAAFWHKEGRTRDALAALKQIVELDPETVANRIKLAELYSKEQMPREAIEEFTRAAEQLKEAGRSDDYMKVAERLLFHSPDNRPVSKELARMYIDKGDPRRALPKLQVCFKADPRDTEVLSLLASAFEALDQRQKAVSVLKELARILNENGDRNARDEVYRRILTLQPGDPDAENALGVGVRVPAASASFDAPPPPTPPPPPGPRPALISSTHSQPIVGGHTGSQPLMSTTFPQPQVSADELPPADEFDEPDTAQGRPPKQPQTAVGALMDDAPRSGDGEEVARILNETDVYIKYKLYAKAIEHVQRVFEHDSRHIEAREKLKALYLTVGKKDEAVLELWALAEQAEPNRTRRYLREILELDPGNSRAAQQLGTGKGTGPAPVVQSPADDDDMNVEELPELDENEFQEAEPSVSKYKMPAHGSDEIRVEDEQAADDDLIPLVVDDQRPQARHNDVHGGEPELEDRFGFGSDEEVESDDGSRSNEVAMVAMEASDSEVNAVGEGADVVARSAEKRPPRRSFATEEQSDDHEVRTRFDAEAVRKLLAADAQIAGNEEVDESDLPAATLTLGTATVPAAAVPQEAFRTEPGNVPSQQAFRTEPGVSPLGGRPPPQKPMLPPPISNKSGTGSQRKPAPPPPEPVGSLEDDLDEADFFVQQSLFDEARQILDALLESHPGHPLVTAKLRDLQAQVDAQQAPAPMGALVDEPGSTADLSAELPTDLPGQSHASPGEGEGDEPVYELTRKGVIEKGVSAEDFETHYDLGIAYKEMGLLDDAIVEFKMVMKDAVREVQCHLMIGLCCLEKGLQTEAIGHFKKGLYVEGITERESLSLYYELGQAYERLGDPREALYYYEKVLKRDPKFRNIEKVVEELRRAGGGPRGGGEGGGTPPATKGDDVDAAFDSLLGDS